ncbi:MAG: sugar ABC transporter permease [Alphaproteobacteria bacterium]|nr:sugar ABC transporter permease [Alphaproteobacteria bacterium]
MTAITATSENGVRTSAFARLREALRGDDALTTAWGAVIVFVTPALLTYAAFTAYPVIRTFWNSVHIIRPGGRTEFVGLDHYVELFSNDDIFFRAVSNTLTWAGVAPLIDVGVGLLLALCLYAKVPFARVFRVAWFTPVLISYVVVAILWMWIYNYDWGVANMLLRSVGLQEWQQTWIGHPDTALWSLIFAHAWKWAGFNMVVCLAAIHALPREVLEAAELDNCGWFQKLIFIIVPMIRPTLVNLLILAFIGKMRVFDLVWIMTGGGPMWSTETVSTYVYKRAFEWNTFDLGYPSTVAAIWFIVVLCCVLGLTWLFRQRDRLEY